MNIKLVLNILGFLVFITGIFMLFGIPFSLYYGDNDVSVLLLTGIGISIIGFLFWFITRKADKSDLGKREGYLIVTLGWVLMSLFGALPFVLHGSIPNYTDAFFETMSGFTTTGATILSDVETLPHGLLFWRSVTHWIGGMGIIVLSLAILPLLGIGGMQLYAAEVPGVTKDKFHPRVKETAKRLWVIYMALTFMETILLMTAGMNFFDALNHSFATLATGGFSTKNNSTAYFTSPYIQYILIFFMFLAGMNFTLHYQVIHKNFSFFKKNDEFKAYLYFILGASVFITLIHLPYVDFKPAEAFRQSLFHVVSLVTTTGFVSSNYENWAVFSKIIFLILLFIGGSAGSTSGGIKIVRHLLLLKNGFLELKRLLHPRAVIPTRLNGKAVTPEIILNVQAFFILYILIFVLGAVILSLMGVDFISSIGGVATCLGNTGPGLGAVGPVSNFGQLPELGKWLLSFLMLLGRLELFTVLIIFTSYFWKK
ncbi:MAG: TrkH family potassium uptake protein [Ignavibacteriaceae bacterium]|nr:TrkH family potassium uptake protein [Ignavibacteriaceae bacterium]